jgi:hypothetical protein
MSRLEVVDFHVAHVAQMQVQRAQRAWLAQGLEALVGRAWTVMVDQRPICCAGVVEMWAGRGYLWALLAQDAGPHMLRLTRAIRARLDGLGFKRLEMAVAAGFSASARWARLLGFECETPVPMRAYAPDGTDCYLYARVTEACN